MANYVWAVFLVLIELFVVISLVRKGQVSRFRHSIGMDLILAAGGVLHVLFLNAAKNELAEVPFIEITGWILLFFYLGIYLLSVLLAWHYGDRSELLIQAATQLTLFYIGSSWVLGRDLHPAAPVLLLLVLVYRYLQQDGGNEHHRPI